MLQIRKEVIRMTQQTNPSSNGHSKMSGKTAATMAGVAGAVVGAGVAVAATQILSDKKTRDKVKETFNKVKTQVMDTIHEEQKRMKASSSNGQKKMSAPKGQKREMDSGKQMMSQ